MVFDPEILQVNNYYDRLYAIAEIVDHVFGTIVRGALFFYFSYFYYFIFSSSLSFLIFFVLLWYLVYNTVQQGDLVFDSEVKKTPNCLRKQTRL